LCGGTFDLFSDLYDWDSSCGNYNSVHRYVCDKCGLTSFWDTTEKGALKELKELINRFPPIMRVQEEDVILCYSGCGECLAKVKKKCKGKNKNIYLKVEFLGIGDNYGVYPYQIIKWPWELKQEGGQQ